MPSNDSKIILPPGVERTIDNDPDLHAAEIRKEQLLRMMILRAGLDLERRGVTSDRSNFNLIKKQWHLSGDIESVYKAFCDKIHEEQQHVKL